MNANHTYSNSIISSSVTNSWVSVHDTDICVFVIRKSYGTIKSNVELEEA